MRRATIVMRTETRNIGTAGMWGHLAAAGNPSACVSRQKPGAAKGRPSALAGLTAVAPSKGYQGAPEASLGGDNFQIQE